MPALASPFHIIAHRGASGYAPENTMAAFERAVAMGATEVETDVSFTRDGKLLLLHDDTVDRTTNGKGLPDDFTLAELKRLDAGSWHDERLSWDWNYAGEKLITLDELLDRFGSRLTYHIELKKPQAGLVEAVADAIVRRGLQRNCFVFGIEQENELREMKRLVPEVRIAWAPETLLATDPMAAVEKCAANGFTMIALNAGNQSRELVARAHALSIEARSSGISSREKMIAAAEIGCNGMTVNWPDWLIDYVGVPGAEDARRLVERVLGVTPTDVRRFTTGAHHYVYEVELPGQSPIVARMSKPSERRAIAGAVRLSEQLRPLGVPLPELLASDVDGAFPWMLLERLPGRDLGEVAGTLSNEQLRAIASRVAEAQAIVAMTPTAGRYGYAADPAAAPHERWIDVLHTHLDRSRRRISSAGLFDGRLVRDVEERMAELEPRLAAIPATPFLHDTTTKNVIVADDGTFSGIVDVDDLCFGDPRYAAALTLAAMYAYGGNMRYVTYWLEQAGQEDDDVFHLYWALFALDLMGEYGQVFNGNERPLSLDAKRRLELSFEEALLRSEPSLLERRLRERPQLP